jgi:hypothetical protein
MRRVERSCHPIRLVEFPLALLVAGQTPIVWSVACVALALTVVVPQILILALSILLTVVLAPLFLSCRFCFQSEWPWFCQHRWSLWSWLGYSWLAWPWLCCAWLWPRTKGKTFLPNDRRR